MTALAELVKCGTVDGYLDHLQYGTTVCGPCRAANQRDVDGLEPDPGLVVEDLDEGPEEPAVGRFEFVDGKLIERKPAVVEEQEVEMVDEPEPTWDELSAGVAEAVAEAQVPPVVEEPFVEVELTCPDCGVEWRALEPGDLTCGECGAIGEERVEEVPVVEKPKQKRAAKPRKPKPAPDLTVDDARRVIREAVDRRVVEVPVELKDEIRARNREAAGLDLGPEERDLVQAPPEVVDAVWKPKPWAVWKTCEMDGCDAGFWDESKAHRSRFCTPEHKFEATRRINARSQSIVWEPAFGRAASRTAAGYVLFEVYSGPGDLRFVIVRRGVTIVEAESWLAGDGGGGAGEE